MNDGISSEPIIQGGGGGGRGYICFNMVGYVCYIPNGYAIVIKFLKNIITF